MKGPILPQASTGYDALLRKVLADWFTRFETWIRPIAAAWSLSGTQAGVVRSGDSVEAVTVGPTATYAPVTGWTTAVYSGPNGSRILMQRNGVNAASLQANATGLYVDSNSGITVFRRGAINVETESMRIDAGGRLLLGMQGTAWTARSTIGWPIAETEGLCLNAIGTFSACLPIVFRVNGVTAGYISHPTATTVQLVSVSDRRLKAEIEDASSASGLIDAIKVRSFDWRIDGSHVSHGFIAQELARVFPEAAALGTPGDDGEGPLDRHGMPWGVDPSKLVALAIKGMQEQAEQIRALEARLSKLEQ